MCGLNNSSLLQSIHLLANLSTVLPSEHYSKSKLMAVSAPSLLSMRVPIYRRMNRRGIGFHTDHPNSSIPFVDSFCWEINIVTCGMLGTQVTFSSRNPQKTKSLTAGGWATSETLPLCKLWRRHLSWRLICGCKFCVLSVLRMLKMNEQDWIEYRLGHRCGAIYLEQANSPLLHQTTYTSYCFRSKECVRREFSIWAQQITNLRNT